MTVEAPLARLLIRVQLTEEQQRQIREQTGFSIRAVPYDTGADFVWCRFGGIVLRVQRGVFAPSSTTEQLLQATLAAASGHSHPVILDVGTGCGAVALATASALSDASVYATDISDIALHCARQNRARLGLHNVRFRAGSLLAPVPRRLAGGVAAVAANVPYVPPRLREAIGGSFPENTAIGTGADGLDLVRELAAAARSFLMPGGSLLLQLAAFQWPGFGPELEGLGYGEPQLQSSATEGPIGARIPWPGRRTG